MRLLYLPPFLVGLAFLLGGCSGGGGTPAVSQAGAPADVAQTSAVARTSVDSQQVGTIAPQAVDSRLKFISGFSASYIANVTNSRELAMLPNGDMLVGTQGNTISIVPNADGAGAAGAARTFITLSEGPAEAVAYAPNGYIYAATNTNVWKIPYKTGALSASGAVSIARVRTGAVAPHSDGDIHKSTSIAVTATTLYAAVGSSCNACVEVDPTRAAVFSMGLDGSHMTRIAQRARNPIALAIDPATSVLWMGGAGQDSLTYKHPYEYFDAPALHGSSNVDYGWPECEENHVAYNELKLSPAPSCAGTAVPAIEFPAYATLIGATFYRATQKGAYAFPIGHRSGIYVTAHGSWHCCPSAPPAVYYVPTVADHPQKAVDWSDPLFQSVPFVSGYGTTASIHYVGHPTGIAVGVNGSLIVASAEGSIMRIRYK